MSTLSAWRNSPALRLTVLSEAIDGGVDVEVEDDIDGHPRPQGWGYDLGADEISCLYLPVIMKNSG